MLDEAFYRRRDEVILCELLNENDVSLGTLGRILEGKIDFSVYRAVRGGGTVTLKLSRDINWESARIKISRGLVLDDGSTLMYGCGVFRALIGDEDWSAEGATVSAPLMDKTSFLNELQMDHTYSLTVGYNVTQAIRELLVDSGETQYSVTDSPNSLSHPMTWKAGTTYLSIINDLADTIGYFSLWADGDGIIRVDPYRRPADRPVVFDFKNDKRSIVTPNFKLLQQPYKVPNKVIGWSRVEGEEPQLFSIATNESPTSPFSYQARGNRWRTETLEDVEVTTQEALDEHVARRLVTATSEARGVEFEHGWLPLNLNEVVSWVNTRAGIEMYGTLVEYEMSLHGGTLMHSKVSEVVTIE